MIKELKKEQEAELEKLRKKQEEEEKRLEELERQRQQKVSGQTRVLKIFFNEMKKLELFISLITNDFLINQGLLITLRNQPLFYQCLD